ncbi:ABC transporter permease [Solimonas soli]|uniref:ABC transporter permease n=1 Tax=Solimonas soli TaxID=413479 RepID=UPI00047FF7D9|nr:ABC transporter permease [Solimonas soli]
MNRLLAMTRARLLEIVRDRTALFWQLCFVPLLITGMAVVLSGTPQPVFTVAVLGDVALTADSHPFLAVEATRFYRETDAAAALARLRRQSTDLLLDLRERPAHYAINTESAKGRLLESILLAKDPDAVAQAVIGKPVRYADWLVPGLLGVNIMFTCLLGIGHVIVRYRKTGFLKRLNGTPLRALEFVGAQLLACLALAVTVSCAVFAICKLVLHLHVEGSYVDLLLVTVLGAMAMIAMSLPVAARITSEELSAGLLNLIAWPMVLLSGVFFSLDGAPALLRGFADLFPLTHLLSAARAVMLDGAGLADLLRPLSAMVLMTVLFTAIGAGFFRWTQD